MTLILLEALGAGLLLVLIVWWTMFSGRDRGEPPQDPDAGGGPAAGSEGADKDSPAARQHASGHPPG